MVDVQSKKCHHDKCTKRPNFNTPDQKTSLYCAEHKLKGMISVINKNCQHNKKCKNDAIYGKSEFHRAQFCETHKQEGLVHIFKERQCCICEMDYDFIIEDSKQKYCMTHCPTGARFSITVGFNMGR